MSLRSIVLLLTLCEVLTAADLLEEAAKSTGLRFEHATGAAGGYFMPEIMGSGVALLDYDHDSDLDVYFVQGAPGKPDRQALWYRFSEDGALRFEDVTEQAGIPASEGSGMGVATGDIDSDGDVDLFLTRFGPDRLLRNNAVTGRSLRSRALRTRVSAPRRRSWTSTAMGCSTCSSLATTASSIQGNKACRGLTGISTTAARSSIRRCRIDSTATAVTAASKTAPRPPASIRAFGNGLGVVAADFNRDTWVDVYVANDKTPNQLWVNQGDGTFVDDALLAGGAYNMGGMAEAGMGVTAGDYDGDGDLDLFLTHIRGETFNTPSTATTATPDSKT